MALQFKKSSTKWAVDGSMLMFVGTLKLCRKAKKAKKATTWLTVAEYGKGPVVPNTAKGSLVTKLVRWGLATIDWLLTVFLVFEQLGVKAYHNLNSVWHLSFLLVRKL